MHVISRKTLRQFWELHPESESALVRWFKIMAQQEFTSFEVLRATFPTADKVGDLIVFNIGGNVRFPIRETTAFSRAMCIRVVPIAPSTARSAAA